MASDSNKGYSVEKSEFWETMYQIGRTPWDLQSFAPPFKTFLDSPYTVKPGVIAVLGCGTGSDCLLFANRGFQVVAIDFAPSAVRATHEKLEKAGALDKGSCVLEKDIFDLHEYEHQFDYVLEHTCFCALHPARRKQYAYAVRDLLKPSGKLIGLWWLLDHVGSGPPYSVSEGEIFEVFKEFFNFDLAYIPQDSVPERQSKELFTLMSLKS